MNNNFINVVSGSNLSTDNAFLEIESSSKKRVILYFGGGLSSNSYMRDKLGPLLLETTFHPSYIPNSHAIITLWETSPFELDSISSIATELFGNRSIGKIRNWIKRKLGISFMGFAPARPEHEVAKGLLKDIGFSEEDIESESDDHLSDTQIEINIKKLLLEDADDLNEGIKEIEVRLNENSTNFGYFKALKVVYKILKRFARKTDHGKYTTVVEELLRLSITWSSSLADLAQGHWKQVYRTSERMWGEGPGKYLLESLDKHCESDPDFKIDLVSHSAGSIAICHLIEELSKGNYPNIKIGNILPVAPAVRMKLFEDTIVKNQSLYENFRMFTLSDEAELGDKLLAPLYNHSLLYFVSGVAEEKGRADMSILGMHRYFRLDGNEPYQGSRYSKNSYRKTYGNLDLIREYLNRDGAVVLSPNTVNSKESPGFESDGDGHENTKLPNESPELARSLIYILSQGETKPGDVVSEKWNEIAKKYHD